MEKEWKYLDHSDCDRCGGSCEVFTQSKDDNSFYDNESVRCTECGLEGSTSVDGDDDDNPIGSVSWNDFEEEEDKS